MSAIKKALFLLMVVVVACRHESPLPTIEGQWKQLVPDHPAWEYDITDNLFRQTVTDFGVVLSDLQFPYAQRGDTLFIGGDAVNLPRVWVVRLIGDKAAEVQELPTAPLNSTHYRILERK